MTDPALYETAVTMTARFYKGPEMPAGVLDPVDGTPVAYVGRHRIATESMFGRRGFGVPEDQTWPDVDVIARRAFNVSAASDLSASAQANIGEALAAAIAYVTESAAGVGVA